MLSVRSILGLGTDKEAEKAMSGKEAWEVGRCFRALALYSK